MKTFKHGKITLLNCDCMEYMAQCKDNEFDLAIVDPPYGIGAGEVCGRRKNTKTLTSYKKVEWDNKAPDESYFLKLKQISENQIIWGANYFNVFPSRCFIVWDKCIGDNDFSMAEIAYASFDSPSKIFKHYHGGNRVSNGSKKADQYIRIHPTQKPIALYKWLLSKYAKPSMRILDTHLGSGSSAIAAHYFGCDFVGMEIDSDYFDAAVERFKRETRQTDLFLSHAKLPTKTPHNKSVICH